MSNGSWTFYEAINKWIVNKRMVQGNLPDVISESRKTPQPQT